MSESVLDASALLAYLQDEPGAARVADALARGCRISAVNWAEVLSKAEDAGTQADDLAADLRGRGILGQLLLVVPLDEALARRIARLRGMTRPKGLSLGDRACLALGLEHDLPVLTTDRAWKEIATGAGVEVLR